MQTQRVSMRRSGTATYATGQETAQRILDEARRLLMEEGHGKLTMRRIAKAAGMSPGNLSYYYPTRADLLADLLQHVIDGYIEQLQSVRDRVSDDAEAQFRSVLAFVFDDLATRETTLFFPELWALANRDDWIAQQMEKMYAQYRAVLVEVIDLINPSLDAARKADLALMICASIEGHTVFVGHGRPHRARGAQLRDLLIDHFLKLVKQSGEPCEVQRTRGP